MPAALTILLGCQLAGEVIVRALTVPVPGPVLGMVMLCALLVLRGGVPANLQSTAHGLLAHLSLLFVPAGVGVMVHLHRIGNEIVAIVAALLLSTALTIAVTAIVFRLVARLTGGSENAGEPEG
ncbi:MAG: CidA/LrgA family protein [Alphaproteobacteria bacterium]